MGIEIWDLTDQSHKPSMSAPVASAAVTSMEFAKVGARSMLAAGDAGGNLHILDMPRSMRRRGANEESIMQAFFEREEEEYRKLEAKFREERGVERDVASGKESSPRG